MTTDDTPQSRQETTTVGAPTGETFGELPVLTGTDHEKTPTLGEVADSHYTAFCGPVGAGAVVWPRPRDF